MRLPTQSQRERAGDYVSAVEDDSLRIQAHIQYLMEHRGMAVQDACQVACTVFLERGIRDLAQALITRTS